MIRQDTRLLAVLFVFLAFLVTLLVMAGEFQPREHRTSGLEDYPPLKVESPEAPEPQRRAIVVSKWLRDVLENAGIPVVQDTEEEEAQADRGCTLIGKLIWENKPWLPLKGVEVRLTESWLDTIVPTEKREANDPVLLPPKATTDKWGKFVLRDGPTRETLFLLVQQDKRTLMVKKLRHLPLPGQVLNLYEVEVPEQGTLQGRIVNDSGRVLPKMTVRAVSDLLNRGPLWDERLEKKRIERAGFFDARGHSGPSPVPNWVTQRDRLLPFPSTTTGRDGRFVLHGVRAGRAALIVRGESAATVERGVQVEAGRVTDVGTLVARADASTEIVISDAKKKRVVGAEVSIQVSGSPMTMAPLRTNLHGIVVCKCLPNGPLTVFVRPQGSQVWEVAHRDEEDSWRSLFFYQLGQRLNGFVDVVDPAGRPVADAVASLSYLDSTFTDEWIELPKHLKSLESEPGSFLLLNLPPGQALRLVIAAPDHAPAVLGFRVGRGDLFRPGGLRVTLRPIFPIRFVVRGINDQLVANARVSVLFQQPPKDAIPGTHDHLLSRGGAVLGHTDENGILDVPAFWRSPAWFAAWHPDYGLTPTGLTDPRPGTVVPIRLRQTGRVVGKLTFTKEPPAGRWVIRAQPAVYFSPTYKGNPFFKTYRTVTAPDGSFYFNDLFKGISVLSLHRLAGDADRSWAYSWPEGERSSVKVVPGMTVLHEWDVAADKLSRFHITGTVQMDGKPLAHAVVRLHTFPDVINPDNALKAIRSALSEAYAEIDHADPLSVRALRNRARRLGALYRQVWRTRRVPPRERLPEELLVLSKDPVLSVRADKTGRFDIALRRPGVFELRLADPQGRQELALAQTMWTRPRGKDTGERRAEVHFKILTGSLRLTLTTHETLRIRRRAIRLTQEPPGAVFRLRTDDQGDVFVRRIPAGKYRLSLDGPGPREVELRNPVVHITAGALNFHNAYTNPFASAVGR